MKNIAFVVSSLKKSGPLSVVYNIIKYIDKSKFNIYIIPLSNSNEKKIDITKINCTVLDMNLSRFKGLFFSKKYLKTIIEEYKIDLLHSHGLRPDILVSKIKNIPACSTLHNFPYEDYYLKYGFLKGHLMSFFHMRATKKMKFSIACSNSIAEKYYNRIKIHFAVIQNGVDISNFTDKVNKTILRKVLKLPQEKKIFISVGSLIKRKDPITIIQAFKSLNESDDKVLIFLGNGVLYNDCKELIGSQNNIHLLGNVNNVSDFLGASDFFISASSSEGLPNTVLEAMSCGLPCILSDISSHREIVKFNSDSSILFNLNNVINLFEIVNNIDELDFLKMSEASLNITNKYLNAYNMSLKYQSQYNEFLRKFYGRI